MRNITAVAFMVVLTGCSLARTQTDSGLRTKQLAAAEAFIDAFYSFDPDRLKTAMSAAQESVPRIGFYQGWAEGRNYRVVRRQPCTWASTHEVQCAVTVKDDLIPALGARFDVTDTFHLTFSGETIVSVRTSSDDPPVFEEALQWVGRERPQILEGPCRGFFDGGPTPSDCARAVVQAFAEFTATKSR